MSARRHRQLFLPFGAEQHFELVHGRHRDAVAVCTKTGARFEQFITEHAHAGELVVRYAACGGTNVYQSQNGFDLPRIPTVGRTVDDVSILTSCYVDLDVYNVPGLEEVDAHALLDKACELAPWLPLPTAVISSGRGYYFQWVFTKPLDRSHLPTWQWVENALVEALAPLGADPTVKDAPRVLRVVGTIHGGTGRMVEGSIVQTSGPLAFERLERAVRAGVASAIQGQPSQRECEHRPASEAQRRQFLSAAELHQLRMMDCHRIAELRGSPKMSECRRRLLYVYAVSGSWYWSDREQAEYELAEFSRQHFKHANRYTGSHVRNIVDLMVNAKSGHAMKAWRGMLVPVRFRLTHSTIIRSLHLTAEEQRHMRTIIGSEERQRRRTQRRRDAGMEPAEAIHARAAERHATAVRMKAEGRRQKDIAQALGITEARVSQMLKAARTAGT